MWTGFQDIWELALILLPIVRWPGTCSYHLSQPSFPHLKSRRKWLLRSLSAQSNPWSNCTTSPSSEEQRCKRFDTLAANLVFQKRKLSKCQDSWQVWLRFLTCLLVRIISNLLRILYDRLKKWRKLDLRKSANGESSQDSNQKLRGNPRRLILSCLKTSTYGTNCPER